MLAFVCNICSATNTVKSEATLHRDKPSCPSCGSNVRFRWTIHALSTALFGESFPLKSFPSAPHVKGLGLSDEPLYADTLAERLGYRNTFLHGEPRFDLKDPECGEDASLDFILATEVFEHVPPPVQPAFDNLSRLLKPDGFVIFSTPWRPQGPTAEYFPNLFHWTLAQLEDEHVLLNRTRDKELEVFDKLNFHGGAGHTLEMRLFSQPDLTWHFQMAGLEPEWATEPFLKYGIVFSAPWSIPCLLRRSTTSNKTAISQGEQRSELARLYQELDSQTAYIRRLEQERNSIKNSKWLRLGKWLNCGPKLS